MNKKVLVLGLIALSMILFAPLVSAQEPETITVWTDKPEYAPGERGTIHVAFYNDRGIALTIEKVIIVFNGWRAYINGQWEGNQTVEVNKAVVSEEVYVIDATFTVPADGRANSTNVSIVVQTSEVGNIPLTPPYYIFVLETSRYMEQIVTLFTVQVVLLIVCTIIIAATIFLSARRPRITWRKEEAAAPAPAA